MKADVWVVSLWPNLRFVMVDYLPHLVEANAQLLARGRVSRSMIVSCHSSDRAAVRRGEKLAAEMKAGGWMFVREFTVERA